MACCCDPLHGPVCPALATEGAWLTGTLLSAPCSAWLTLCSVADMVPLLAEWAHVWTHADVAAEGVCSHH